MAIILNRGEPKKLKPTAKWMELVLSDYFNIRRNLVVPRVSWGLDGEYEKDLVVVYPSGWAYEIEIKVTKADVKADLKKRHGHRSNKMQKLYFAIPKSIHTDEVVALIPERAGIIVVNNFYHGDKPRYTGSLASTQRGCKINQDARKLTDDEVRQIQRLGYLRYWSQARRQFKDSIK